jgi:competence protein ComEA
MKFFLKKTCCLGLLTLAIAVSPQVIAQTAQSNVAKSVAAVQNEEQLVDINTADAKTLERQLEGIGPKKATAIVEYREKHGLFKSLSDLEQVYGIGEKTLERNRDKIKIVIPNATQEHSSPPASPTAAEEKSPTAETTITDQTAPPTQEANSALKGEEF